MPTQGARRATVRDPGLNLCSSSLYDPGRMTSLSLSLLIWRMGTCARLLYWAEIISTPAWPLVNHCVHLAPAGSASLCPSSLAVLRLVWGGHPASA